MPASFHLAFGKNAREFSQTRGKADRCECCGRTKFSRQLYPIEEHQVCKTCRDRILVLFAHLNPEVCVDGKVRWTTSESAPASAPTAVAA